MPELTMSAQTTRRESLKRGLAAAGLLAFVPDWATPALAQGEVDVPFTDIPATFNPNNATTGVRMLDIRKIDGPFTSKDDFFTIQHMGKPEIDAATYKLSSPVWSINRPNSRWRIYGPCGRPSWLRATSAPGTARAPSRDYLHAAASRAFA